MLRCSGRSFYDLWRCAVRGVMTYAQSEKKPNHKIKIEASHIGRKLRFVWTLEANYLFHSFSTTNSSLLKNVNVAPAKMAMFVNLYLYWLISLVVLLCLTSYLLRQIDTLNYISLNEICFMLESIWSRATLHYKFSSPRLNRQALQCGLVHCPVWRHNVCRLLFPV